MAGNELQVLSIGDHELDGGEVPVSGVRGDGKGMDPEVKNYFLDPFRMVAACSLATPEQAQHLEELKKTYADRPAQEFVEAASEYLVGEIGKWRIEMRHFLMRMGEYKWPDPSS
jgi:hypothetical protein